MALHYGLFFLSVCVLLLHFCIQTPSLSLKMPQSLLTQNTASICNIHKKWFPFSFPISSNKLVKPVLFQVVKLSPLRRQNHSICQIHSSDCFVTEDKYHHFSYKRLWPLLCIPTQILSDQHQGGHNWEKWRRATLHTCLALSTQTAL